MPQREIGLGAMGIGIADGHQAGIDTVLPKFADGIVDRNAQAVSEIICVVTDK